MTGWTAIVLTCQTKDGAQAFQKELEQRQQKGFIPPDVLVLAVEDPKAQVGSGGATLNALLVAVEHMSAQQGHTVIDTHVLDDARILVLHMGRLYPFDPCGRAFVTAPQMHTSHTGFSDLMCNIDLLMDTITHKLACDSPPGLWVCSTDMWLNMAAEKVPWPDPSPDVAVITVPATVDYALSHGVYKIDEKGFVEDVLYQSSTEELEKCHLPSGKVPLVTGVVYFSTAATETLLSLHVKPPLDACTYLGLDSGAHPITLSLFFDFLLPMCSSVNKQDFITGNRSGLYGKAPVCDESSHTLRQSAKAILWKELSHLNLQSVLISEGSHSFMDQSPKTHLDGLLHQGAAPAIEGSSKKPGCTHSHVSESSTVGNGSVIINSVVPDSTQIGSRTVVSHCHLPAGVVIGNNCLLQGLLPHEFTTATFPSDDNLSIIAFHVQVPSDQQRTKTARVLTLGGLQDSLLIPFGMDGYNFCNLPLTSVMNKAGIKSEDLWPADEAAPTIMTARLYPVDEEEGPKNVCFLLGQHPAYLERWRVSKRMSIKEIMQSVDHAAEFSHRRQLFYEVTQRRALDILLQSQHKPMNHLYKSTVADGFYQQMLDSLDTVAKTCGSPGIAARTLANIAEVLCCMAGSKGGLRSGPAGNRAWASAFQLFEQDKITEGVEAMAIERVNWFDRPDLLVRAARHYEGAAQILIRHSVATAREFIEISPAELPAFNEYITASCPARIDLSGGWSDTPPITYEHGGAVTIAAITIDNKRPIGASARRIKELEIRLVLQGEGGHDTKVTVCNHGDMQDYYQPHAPGALLKSAFLCTQIISLDSADPLQKQLLDKYQGGFELTTWSDLPHGSGLGTSSILAGAVMAVLWTVSGVCFSLESLTHAVLHLEQMLTTGGGWQDQVGGLTPGVKVAHSPASIPVQIHAQYLNISQANLKEFSDRLILIYTGKTRLARNLLQNVVRNWYARNPEIVSVQDGLVENAWRCSQALVQGDLAAVGQCMDIYWEQKKLMAPGCEPAAVRRIMAALRPHTYGMSMAGAGGGGFLYVLMKQPNQLEVVQGLLSQVENLPGVSVHKGEVDETGIQVMRGTAGSQAASCVFPS